MLLVNTRNLNKETRKRC